jgi:Mg2+ and Co2+ transporter CorA
MPELSHPLGYPIIMGLIIFICTGLYIFFRRWNWL